ncbi:hypothetical protein [Treponema denticola]|uniref:hypothetical protein n=1 Tax=Treponema denticola TaxID=158 RepID=UPI0001FD3B91|nr:hypothetical protein [Treponema denticola]EGC77894.1 hypothetical protein HMPREF9353_00741 [Treponema denticola F0402]
MGFGIGIVYLSFGEHTSNLSAANIDSVYIQDVINIFVNNMRLILGNILGFFTFGIFPIINLLINGFVLAGFVFIGLQAKISIKTICFATLPHFLNILLCGFLQGLVFIVCTILNNTRCHYLEITTFCLTLFMFFCFVKCLFL